MNCLILSFGFKKKYPLFGYELNKLNNYLMTGKPIIALGNKKNLLKDRGEFIFITSDNSKIFEKKLRFVKSNYKYFLEIASLNKIKLLKRNNPYVIFNQTVKELNKL